MNHRQLQMGRRIIHRNAFIFRERDDKKSCKRENIAGRKQRARIGKKILNDIGDVRRAGAVSNGENGKNGRRLA